MHSTKGEMQCHFHIAFSTTTATTTTTTTTAAAAVATHYSNPRELQRAPTELASRFFQLASGHAMIAPFLKEKFGWIRSDVCWWCESGRQTREHLFKECLAWKEEIRELWKEMGEATVTEGDDKRKQI